MATRTEPSTPPSAEEIHAIQNCYGYVAEALGFGGPARVYGIPAQEKSARYTVSHSFDADKTAFFEIKQKSNGNTLHAVSVDPAEGGYELSHRRNSGQPVETTNFPSLFLEYPPDEFEYIYYQNRE